MQTKPDTESKEVVKQIEIALTTEEFADRGRTVAKLHRGLREVKAEFDTSKKSFKMRIGEIEDDIQAVAQVISMGREMRTIECKEVKDFDRHVVQYVKDGEILSERAMELEERQMEIVKGPHSHNVNGVPVAQPEEEDAIGAN